VNECDTNADTCFLGTNFVILDYTMRTADVYAYDKSITPIENVPIVKGAMAYDDLDTGRTYILVFHESLFYGQALDHSLINPNQLRSYGVNCWNNPFDDERGLCIEIDNIKIDMQTKGTKVQFETRVPTKHELETCKHIEMTSPKPWEPSQVLLQEVRANRFAHDVYDEDAPFLRQISPCLTNLSEVLTKQACELLASLYGRDRDRRCSC
jgi:hypothetical protein